MVKLQPTQRRFWLNFLQRFFGKSQNMVEDKLG